MAKVDSRWHGWSPRLLSILRIVASFLFMQHGAQKLFGFLATRPGPERFSQAWIGGGWNSSAVCYSFSDSSAVRWPSFFRG
jgi:uncharacterized membrane protein YphA (DoxX/SURF4 family)